MSSGTVTMVEQPLFVRKGKHELAKLLKSIEDVTPEAVEFLIDVVRNEKESTKERRQAAASLIEFNVKISAEINKDQITRQIAEIKAKGLSRPLGPDGGEPKPGAPRLDFNTIQQVGDEE